MSSIFQITKEMVEHSSTLEPEDVGLWCYLVQGCYQGFFKDKDKAYLSAKSVFRK